MQAEWHNKQEINMEIYKNKSKELLTETFEGISYVEEWKDIRDWDGVYQASSFGRVKSLSRVIRWRSL